MMTPKQICEGGDIRLAEICERLDVILAALDRRAPVVKAPFTSLNAAAAYALGFDEKANLIERAEAAEARVRELEAKAALSVETATHQAKRIRELESDLTAWREWADEHVNGTTDAAKRSWIYRRMCWGDERDAAVKRTRELEAELRVSRAAQAAEYTSRCEALDKVDRLRESRRKWRELCIEFKTTWNWHSVSDWICRRDALAASDAAEEKQP